MRRSILIPVRVIRHVDSMPSYNRPELNVGDIYDFCPTDYIDLDLEEVNCFEQIPNEDCDFTCLIGNLNLGYMRYSWNEPVDYKKFTEQNLKHLLELGYIKKSLKKKETRRPLHQFLNEYSITREDIIDFINSLGIQVQDKRSWITKSDEDKILEVITNDN